MFVWVFHRISGVLLIFLLLLQLLTGLVQSSVSSSEGVQDFARLHNHAVLNGVLVFLVMFHAVYGLRTILMDLGVRRERLLFWTCTAVGLLLFAGFLTALAVAYG